MYEKYRKYRLKDKEQAERKYKEVMRYEARSMGYEDISGKRKLLVEALM